MLSDYENVKLPVNYHSKPTRIIKLKALISSLAEFAVHLNPNLLLVEM
jgi:hypothetical protein